MPRFLVLQLARFGDLVQSKRLMHTLLARGETHLCLPAGLRDLAALLYPDAELHTVEVHQPPSQAAVAGIHATLRELGQLAFDAVYNCNHSPLNLSLTRFFPPCSLHGYHMRHGQETRSKWIRLLFRLTKQRVLTPVNLVDFWAHLAPSPCPPQAVTVAPKPAGDGVIGVVLAGRESRRSLPPALLGQCLRTTFEAGRGRKVLLLGSKAEAPVARQLLRQLPAQLLSHVEDLSGKTDWRALYALMPGLDMLLTPDTGLMHLAAHRGVPVKAVFLSSAWCHETGPYGQGHSIWQASADCAPCLESAPCHLETLCAQPFGHKNFLRSLALDLTGTRCPPQGEAAAPQPALPPLPDGLTLYHSRVDALGVGFTPVAGEDRYAGQRAFLRERIAEYLLCPLAPTAATHPPPAEDVREALTALVHDDAQWMLP